MSNSLNYQRHIDGLRAVAVLSVVFFHYGQAGFGGGFVGVDVFFVISGYLITNLILSEISDTGDFSFRRFYIRRIRRLFPALAVTLALSLVFAVALFSPEQLQNYGRSLAAAVFSVSNIQFWLDSGYFDSDGHLKPLLHTWSLSVEEQFYLIWPALLWLFARGSGPRRQLTILAILGAGSFALNYLWVNGQFDPEFRATIFYLTPFRIFELVIGGMAIFLTRTASSSQWLHELAMATGLALIAYSVYSYSELTVFPYLSALTPCLGALLVIASPRSQFVGSLLTNRLAVGIGLISYSLYLVHWPVLIFYEYYTFVPLEQSEAIALFILSCVLSVLMYFYVEKPFRKNSPSRIHASPQKAFVFSSVSLMILIGIAGFQIGRSDGRTWLNEGALSANKISAGKLHRLKPAASACTLLRLDKPKYCDGRRKHQILVIGNSHELDGFNAFAQVYKNNPDVNLIMFGNLNPCHVQIIDGIPVSKLELRKCDRRVALLNEQGFVSSLSGVIYSSNIPYDDNKKETWEILQNMTKLNPDIRTIVLGGYINTIRDCSELYNRFGSLDACKNPEYLSYDPFAEQDLLHLEQLSNGLNYLYIDKTRLLCTGKTVSSCRVKFEGEPAFWDKHHLSTPFARYMGRRIAKEYGEELYKSGFPRVTSRERGNKADKASHSTLTPSPAS